MRSLHLLLLLSLILQCAVGPGSYFLCNKSAESLKWGENEGDHYPCSREWWNVDAFFVANGKNWSLTASFEYEMETPACNLFLTLFNLDDGTCYSLGSYGDEIGALLHEKGDVDVRYEESWMKGRYPHYFVHFERGEFIINMCYTAVSPPKFVAEDISNGILPMGFGYYIYGIIPFCIVEGNISINGNTFPLSGKGYYEHVWGNWTYGNPLSNPSNFEKVASAYYHLGKWWLNHHKLSIPSSVTLASDNNMFGYDWVWATFSNNWSLFYGNILFWVMKGPVFGILYLVTSDGEYITFCDIHHEYGKMVYVEEYDVYFPSEIFITAEEGTKKLSLHFSMKTDVHTYWDTNLSSKYWRAIALWEAPGIVNGYYTDGEINITLNGKCEIEPERQISILGHSHMDVNFFTHHHVPAVKIEIVSHPLGIQIEMDASFFPFLKTSFSLYFLEGI